MPSSETIGAMPFGTAPYHWTYGRIETGGEKWQLHERTGRDHWRIVATIVRLPGTLTRVFAGDELRDFPSPAAAGRWVRLMWSLAPVGPGLD